jgi:hypothetical protein
MGRQFKLRQLFVERKATRAIGLISKMESNFPGTFLDRGRDNLHGGTFERTEAL